MLLVVCVWVEGIYKSCREGKDAMGVERGVIFLANFRAKR